MATSDPLTVAIDKYKLGEKLQARQLLIKLVVAEPNNESAWLWLAACVDRIEHKKDCLRRALRINPTNGEAEELLKRYDELPILIAGQPTTRNVPDSPDKKPISIYVAGVRYGNGPQIVCQLHLLQLVNLCREPENPHDSNAIRVETQDGTKIGFVPKTFAAVLAEYMDRSGESLSGCVTDLTGDLRGSNVRVQIAFYVPITERRIHQAAEEAVFDGTQRLYYFDHSNVNKTFLMLECSEIICERILETLAQRGIPVTRLTMAYHAAADGRYYRWCIRLDDVNEKRLREIADFLESNYRLSRSVDDLVTELEKQTVDAVENLQLAELFSDEAMKHSSELDTLRENNERLATEAREKAKRIALVEAGNKEIIKALSKPEPASDISLEKLYIMLHPHLTANMSPEQVLHIIAYLFENSVIVLDSAKHSAEKSKSFKYGGRLFELLWKLAIDYWESLCSGSSDEVARQVFGKEDYAAQESETTKKNRRARDARTFVYHEQSIFMPQHLKIGAKDSVSETIRVHFKWLAEESKIIIGYCGPHLPLR
jgi:hypothetical protein